MVGDHAVTFHKGDVDDLTVKLGGLLSDSAQVMSLKTSAADYITDKYSWDDVVDRTLALYRPDR